MSNAHLENCYCRNPQYCGAGDNEDNQECPWGNDCECSCLLTMLAETASNQKQDEANAYAQGYEAALRDAVEAVQTLPPITDAYPTSDPAGGLGLSTVTHKWLCNRDHAVAAIEALGGKQ